jgi:hypothetical protein
VEEMNDAREVVMSYIRALDSQDYDTASTYLSSEVRVKGPAGEMFSKPKEFIDMLRSYHGRYDLKKVFTDENDVCLLYDLKTPTATVFIVHGTKSIMIR